MNRSSQFVREGRGLLNRLAKPDKPSLTPPSLGVGAVILFLTLADLITLKTLFNATFTEQPAIIWILSLVAAVLLDVPMSVAGLCVSQSAKGMRSKTNTICVTAGCLAAFLLPLFLCLDLRMTTRDFVFTGIGASRGDWWIWREAAAWKRRTPAALCCPLRGCCLFCPWQPASPPL